jgi:SprT protein
MTGVISTDFTYFMLVRLTGTQVRYIENALSTPLSHVTTFQKYFPAKAVHYCHELWQKYPFHLRIVGARSSKFGDYRYLNGVHRISVNENLNPYAFTVTYIHEVAHLLAFQKYGTRAAPHGKEWKRTFQQLMAPLLNPEVFPAEVLRPLQVYMHNPKASSCADPALFRALHYAAGSNQLLLLRDLRPGEHFQLNGRLFERGELRRTRVLCLERSTGRKYTITGHAVVERVGKQ